MRYKTLSLSVTSLLTFIFVSCSIGSSSNTEALQTQQVNSVSQPSIQDTNVIKVYVDKDSLIAVNGKNVSLAGLDTLLFAAQTRGSMVYYSRYNAHVYEGPQVSLRVLDLVIKHNLRLRFYTDSTFTEVAPIN